MTKSGRKYRQDKYRCKEGADRHELQAFRDSEAGQVSTIQFGELSRD
jgi:hypothetical protein